MTAGGGLASDPQLMALISLNRASSLKLRLLCTAGLSVFLDVVCFSERLLSSEAFDFNFNVESYYVVFLALFCFIVVVYRFCVEFLKLVVCINYLRRLLLFDLISLVITLLKVSWIGGDF